MLQRDVAEQIGVDKTTVFNWEANAANPEIRYMPAIIRFLGYNPLAEAKSLAEQLVRHRTALGLSQKESAKRLGVDPGGIDWSRRAPGCGLPRNHLHANYGWLNDYFRVAGNKIGLHARFR